MPSTLILSTLSAVRAWARARVPTRESIVSAGALALIFGTSYLAAFFLRGELLLKSSDAETILRTIRWVVVVKLTLFYLRGICHRPLRALRFDDVSLLVRTTTTALLVFVAANHYGPQLMRNWVQIPRTVLLLDWAFTLLAVGGVQAAARSVYEEILPANPVGHQRSALVVDGTPAGRAIAASLAATRSGFFVTGLLDDDRRDASGAGGEFRIIGAIDNAAACAGRLRVSDVVVRQGSVFGGRLRRLYESCAAVGVRVWIAETPSFPASDSGDGSAGIPDRVDVRALELRDLITHAETRLERFESGMRSWLDGETVLVTGAGGSIGAEICRQLVALGPAKILLVDRSECALFEIHAELVDRARQAGPRGSTVVEPILADITSAERMEQLFRGQKPGIVIHAAAYKHVSMLERYPTEAIENNVFATASLAGIADRHGVRSFIALSTDKAVHPCSVMGATKLVAERVLQSFSGRSATRFVIVRFGNVLGSSGSAVGIFRQQLLKRRPVTITAPDVSRFFLTGAEAARLVLFAGSVAKNGGTFVLDMGDPLPVVELVERMAMVMRIPSDDFTIRFIGLRPGEKLTEKLFFDDEIRRGVADAPVFQVERPGLPSERVGQWIADLQQAIDGGTKDSVRATLMEIVASDCPSAVAQAGGQQRPTNPGTALS